MTYSEWKEKCPCVDRDHREECFDPMCRACTGREPQIDEISELVRENYYKANADYIAEQIEIANGARKWKCDFCGTEFEPNKDDLLFEFITKNGTSTYVCEDCMIHKGKEIENEIAKKNVN